MISHFLPSNKTVFSQQSEMSWKSKTSSFDPSHDALGVIFTQIHGLDGGVNLPKKKIHFEQGFTEFEHCEGNVALIKEIWPPWKSTFP